LLVEVALGLSRRRGRCRPELASAGVRTWQNLLWLLWLPLLSRIKVTKSIKDRPET
jgi:hypothetical protein